MKTQSKQDLASIFTQIEVGANAVEEIAGKILAAIKEAKAETLDAFNAMTNEAFDKKGWSRRIGRPEPGDVPAPASVKVYISTIRAAYRMGVDVPSFLSIGDLRKALRKAREAAGPASRRADPAPEMKGVKVERPGALNGSMWHDVIVLWENLPDTQQHQLEEGVKKLLARFKAKAPPALRLVA